MNIELMMPDKSTKSFDKPPMAKEFVQEKDVIGVKVSDRIYDLQTPITESGSATYITSDSKEGLQIIRHSAAHIMAHAIRRLHQDVKLGVGPNVEDGFYYDIDVKKTIGSEDFKAIEEEMRKIIKENLPFVRKEVTKADALKIFDKDEYKVELINELEEAPFIYSSGDFTDLCRGPHVPSTGYVKAYKIMKVAGAYWKGDQKNAQLQRVYGTAFDSKEKLKEYLAFLEEAKKRDHRTLGKQMQLFSFHDEGPGFPFWHNKGMILREILINYWRQEHRKNNYQEISTPIMLSRKLWEQSGHWFNYRENMYTTQIDGEDFAIKPMNCPGGMLLYSENIHSYKELPLRVGELGLVHRHELSGVLSGLFRVRTFTQDDAHIFMTPEHIKDEVLGVMRLVDQFYSLFGFSYHVELSTRPAKSIGTDEQWNAATEGLKGALLLSGKDYKVNEGDGAFYGPKIDFHIKDAIGRSWQCATIQLDMSLPERFNLTYDGADGQKHRPVMIHRVIFGAIERFIGILIEHYAGKFPLWLNPVQVKVLTVADRFEDYAKEVALKIRESGLRVELDIKSETVSKKVRNAQLEKVNYILVVGEKEEADKTVTVRRRDGNVSGAFPLDDFIEKARKEDLQKIIEPLI